MNKQESDILKTLITEPFINQRILSEKSRHSLGVVNRSIKELIKAGYLNEAVCPTEKALSEYKKKTPKRAIILAAGFGMRMVPINTEIPKGLLKVNDEPLVERLIKQLREVGVTDVYIIVGFMKESYYYLQEKYDVHIIENDEYKDKNNLYSLSLALNHLSNTYIVPCDIWCRENPFRHQETASWYMVSDLVDDDSSVRVNRKMELITVPKSKAGNAMVGIAYLNEADSKIVRARVSEFVADGKHDNDFWESTLYKNGRMFIPARIASMQNVVEINTYEQLRELDSSSEQLKTEAIDVICQALAVKAEEVTDIKVLKKGMTNRSFLFRVSNSRYIMRIPGEGTDQLIDREQEADVYKAIASKKICDDIIYINPSNGYKITRYLDGARVCDINNTNDVKRCMSYLRDFHSMKLKVKHEFKIFDEIEFYESLWDGKNSVYKDYKKVKAGVLSLKIFIDKQNVEKCLTHIDAVPDNFLFSTIDGKEEIRLIDWEYAGMQDPHLDIAMFAIYSCYNKRQIDRLIDYYFEDSCSEQNRVKIYCYIAIAGLLWSNWCEYKRQLGIEFGEYAEMQYKYAKKYYKLALQKMSEL